MRLLAKGKQGVLRMIFSRMGIVLLFLALNVCILFAAFIWFGDFLPYVYGGTALFTIVIVVYLINSRTDPTAKMTWLVVIMLLPVFGSLFYLFTCTELGHKAVARRLQRIYNASGNALDSIDALEDFSEESVGASALVRYVGRVTGVPVCRNTEVKYFPLGEMAFDSMLSELEKAEKSIYLEYFILDEGEMWGRILEILARKASEGVDVRVMYDGTCEFYLLPKSYPKKLEALGIKCRVFAPITPFVSTHYNYRDHRKIMTVDGKVAFTGGVNLADEYINAIHPLGHFKDTAVMLRGDAAKSFELMFLQVWHLEDDDFFAPVAEREDTSVESKGFVLPYYEDPLDDEQVARQVYIDILNRARKSVSIMTPYMIMDTELESALTYAAKRGVDVTLILPSKTDHIVSHILAKNHYPALVASGVRVYEYTPGFVHAKVVVADGREATVGTVNFDYRSLYHHFECGAYLYGVPCISDIIADFEDTVSKSKSITSQTIRDEKLINKLAGKLLKIVAPLL